MTIEEEITSKLHVLEKEKNVKILFAVESGSRSWGFPSIDSDYDCRFVYVDEKDYYITLLEKRDLIEYELNEVFDIVGWNIKKFLKLLLKSNVTCLEWLSIENFYMVDENLRSVISQIAFDYYNPISTLFHYRNIACKMNNDILTLDKVRAKRYFYVLRALSNIDYIYKYDQFPDNNFNKTIDKLDLDNDLYNEIKRVQKIKLSNNEKYSIEQNKLFNIYICDQLKDFENKVEDIKKRGNNVSKNYQPLDTAFRTLIDEVWK